MMHNDWYSREEVLYCFSRSSIKFQGYMSNKIDDFNPIWSKITTPDTAIKSLRFALFYSNRVIAHWMWSSVIENMTHETSWHHGLIQISEDAYDSNRIVRSPCLTFHCLLPNSTIALCCFAGTPAAGFTAEQRVFLIELVIVCYPKVDWWMTSNTSQNASTTRLSFGISILSIWTLF